MTSLSRSVPVSPDDLESPTPPGPSLFWRLAEVPIRAGTAERGTLMGFDCLRASPGGGFAATVHHVTGHLVVKLTPARVSALIGEGVGRPFAPAGRVFKAWVEIPDLDEELWRALIDEALSTAST